MATGICPRCKQRVKVYGSRTDLHLHENEDCPGSHQTVERNSLEARGSTKLPAWVMAAISEEAYDRGHAYGQPEIVGITEGMIEVFERHLDNQKS